MSPDIVLISEQNRNKNNWFTDTKGDAAIWVTNQGIHIGYNINLIKKGIGMVIISSYISPNIDSYTVDDRLDEITDVIKYKRWRGIFLAGDFNSKSLIWGSNCWNPRGKKLLDYLLRENLSPIYTRGGNTCIKGAGSKIDLLLTSINICYSVKVSVVLNEFTGSDHQYLWHEIELDKPETIKKDINKKIKNKNKNKGIGNGKKEIIKEGIDSKKYIEVFLRKFEDREGENYVIGNTIHDIKNILENIQKITNECRKKNLIRPGRYPVYWWTPEIAEQRKCTNKLRRKITRLRKKQNKTELDRAISKFKQEKRNLNRMIRNAKKESLENFMRTIDNDIWGKPYKMVIKQLKLSTPPIKLDVNQTIRIIEGLFTPKPASPGIETSMIADDEIAENLQNNNTEINDDAGRSITEAEIILACKKIAVKKAPGPDGIPAVVAKK